MSDVPGSGGPGPVEPREPQLRSFDQPPPSYTKYRTRPRLLPRRGGDAIADLRAGDRGGQGLPRTSGGRRAWTWQRALKWVTVAVVAWVGLSVVLFFLSATIQSGKTSDATKAALDDAGYPLTSVNNVLVLGSDQRAAGTKEPGASTSGPSRSDSIMLLRIGGGHNSRLSIARDTMVDIPGHGRSKINAAYAYGGAALAIQTVKQYLGVEVNHVIEVNFARFPGLINALGGVTYEGNCVLSRINGGTRNGGYTLRLKKGRTHINGNQALALARTRKNICRPNETDLDRAKRQQFLITAMKSKLASPGGMFGIPNGAFYRLPLVGWRIPRAFTSDMGGFTLSGVFAAMGLGGNPTTQVLGTLSGEVPQAQKDAAVRRFLKS
jgi:LCP family protein required for cell wall assembly